MDLNVWDFKHLSTTLLTPNRCIAIARQVDFFYTAPYYSVAY